MLQGQRDLATVGKLLLTELVPLVNAHQGVIYRRPPITRRVEMLASYADAAEHGYPQRMLFGEGFVGQVARDRKRMLIPKRAGEHGAGGPVFFTALLRLVVVFDLRGQSRRCSAWRP